MTRIPPPVLAVLAMLAQRQLSPKPPPPTTARRTAAATVALASVGIAGTASNGFRRTGTTVDPIHPDRATTLVTGGPFRFTRNPMYVGMTGLVLANAVRRGAWLGVVPLAVFFAVMDRVQIAAEEPVLREKFGTDYEEYRADVPRWLDKRSLSRLAHTLAP
ncbi:methyltransferase family protein [Nocardioides caldifontis]|uniref:methyltransferase family protein n=1 Tax=Nocardioides caldifontis TaxID=2588938 RepID=UPI001EEFB8E4|nr:isoprenylcysteine carboxylmethyltransferase family protein [Nocardioides caldifontis]